VRAGRGGRTKQMKEPAGSRRLSQNLQWLYATQTFGVKLGLEGMRRLAGALGIRTGGPGAPRFLHVAGTNGKGSTCALMESVCRAAGWRTGLYTSPHLVSLRERFRLDGEPISAAELCAGLERIRAFVSDWEPHPTFFEIVTALGLEWFQRKGAEFVVLETGLGGRLDATNIVTPAVSVLTPIGLDHQKYLGDTLVQIAAEKAGIIKHGVPVVSAPQTGEVLALFALAARERGATFETVSQPWTRGPVGLAGPVQRWNAALAVAALEAAGLQPGEDAVHAGLAQVQWPGRFQCLGPDLIVDGAHNPDGAAALVDTWREVFPGEKASLIFGALDDKDAAAVLKGLLPIVAELTVVPVQSPRALDLARLRHTAAAVLGSCDGDAAPRVFEAPDLVAALARRAGVGRRLVTGSLYLVGEALALRLGVPRDESLQ
jgi:dihydrofolate synthase/folylpolyglutamate synthase